MNDNVVTEEIVNKDNSNVVLKPKFIPLYIETLEMWLSLIEASIYWFVEFFLSTNKHFYCTNEQIANMLHIWTTAVSKAINKLNDLWLIYTEYRIRSWWGKIRFIKLLKRVDEINQTKGVSENKNIFMKMIPEVVIDNVAVDNTDVVKEDKKDKEWNNNNQLFDEFREKYPRKVWKKDAMKKFDKLKKEDQELAIKMIDVFKKTKQWQNEQYIPHPTTYINQERFRDEIDTSTLNDNGNEKQSKYANDDRYIYDEKTWMYKLKPRMF